MKTHKLAGSICALLLTALGASSAVAQTSSPAAILFMRTHYRAIDSSHGTTIYRVQPSGGAGTAMTPVTYKVDYRGASWSPNGGSFAYEAADQVEEGNGQTEFFKSQLYVVGRQGGSARQITTGPGLHTQEAWGPDQTIAFITTDTGSPCVGAVRSDGTGQRILFCPKPISREGINSVSTPQWALPGQGVYVEVRAYTAALDTPQLDSRVYRVNVYNGNVVLLSDHLFGDPDNGGDSGPMAIAPDGTHGVYGGYYGGPSAMYLIDFATDTLTPLSSTGSGMRYSKDGSKIAFVHSDPNASGYDRIYVMDADGSDAHPAMANPDPNATYPAVTDWSFDDSHLLVNKVGDDRWLQEINLGTGRATTVTKGTADNGAWFHP